MANSLPPRLRYNYVLSEVDFVLFEDLASYAIVTENFLYQNYQGRFGKDLKASSELEQLNMNLRELVEEEFGAYLKWMADSEFNAIVRRSPIDTQQPVDPPAKDANANILPPRTLQDVEAHHAPADANNGYATPAWKDNRKLQELLSYLQESEALVADDQLVATRTAKTVKFNGDRRLMAMNFVDYYALVKYGGHLSLDHYDSIRELVDFDDFSDQNFGRELRDVRLRIVGDGQMDAFYGFHHPVIRWNDTKLTVPFGEAFPRMPRIAVFTRGQSAEGSSKTSPLTFVTMERLEIFDDKELIFACIRLARLKKLRGGARHEN